jgi:hypothetical protein
MTDSLVPICDAGQITSLEALVTPVVESPGHLNMRWVRAHGFTAVPVESASHFDDSDAGLLGDAIQANGETACFAIATEHLANFPRCFSLEPTRAGLLSFSRQCAHFNFLLAPKPLSFVVLCTVYDYFIVSGSLAFVETALGCEVRIAQARFIEFATSCVESKRLLDVARRYDSRS